MDKQACFFLRQKYAIGPLSLLLTLAAGVSSGRNSHKKNLISAYSSSPNSPLSALRSNSKPCGCHYGIDGGGNRNPYGQGGWLAVIE